VSVVRCLTSMHLPPDVKAVKSESSRTNCEGIFNEDADVIAQAFIENCSPK
jgi:hypothetical protein